MELLKRFEGHDLEPGTVVIREGDAGQGLFVMLLGEVEVLHKDPTGTEKRGGAARRRRGVRRDVAARRSPDDRDRARRCRATTIMFLARDYFRRLVSALPPLRQYFEELSKQRRRARV